MLQRAIVNDHLPHAYLFVGTEGIGKKLTALNLAKTVNCEEGKEDSCDRCLSCRKIEDANHPDVSVITPEGQFIRIDKIRELQRSMSYRPFEGKMRVCIVDGADHMKVEGANALLKTLEEPPPRTLLILLASETDLLLPTIISRCQQITFTALSTDQMVTELTERHTIEEREARTVAALAQGSLGRALQILEQEIWEKRSEVIHEIMDLPSHDVGKAFAVAGSLADFGESLPLVFLVMMTWYRDLIIWNEQRSTDLLINQDLCEEVKKAASQMSRRSLIRRIEAIHETSRALSRNANRLLALENLLLQLR
jgi:DNA polymerase-3 subunit delta'